MKRQNTILNFLTNKKASLSSNVCDEDSTDVEIISTVTPESSINKNGETNILVNDTNT